MKYGLYYFKNTHNLGDDMWAYAQSLFLPHIDYLIDNISIYNFKSDNNEPVAAIMSAFIEPYNYEYSFCPPANIYPLFIGSYFRPTMYEFLDTELMKKYLYNHSPIGTRSKEISDFLKKRNIDSYFSGCISMTLPALNIPKQNYICLVDVPNYVIDYVKKHVGDKYEIKVMTHDIVDIKSHSEMCVLERFNIIKKLLETYSRAHCVITSRLHVALPCLTQDTPVLLTVTDESSVGVNDIERRIKDFYPYVHHNYYSDFLNDNVIYDFIDPPKNDDLYLDLRNKLIETCTDFISKCESGDIEFDTSENISELKYIDILQKKLLN